MWDTVQLGECLLSRQKALGLNLGNVVLKRRERSGWERQHLGSSYNPNIQEVEAEGEIFFFFLSTRQSGPPV